MISSSRIDCTEKSSQWIRTVKIIINYEKKLMEVSEVSEKISRDPGTHIKRQLRQEVNFGCPVRYPNGQGCGCPVLTYHHFDPPWAEKHQHDPVGMIALCPEHHGHADGGRWTVLELRAFKKNPFVDSRIRHPWPHSSQKLLVRSGPDLVVGSGAPLRLYGQPVIEFYPEPIPALGIDAINVNGHIEDREQKLWLKISDGFLDLDITPTSDVTWPPHPNRLEFRHRDGTYMKLRYTRIARRNFDSWWCAFDRKNRFGSAKEFLRTHDVLDSDGCVPIMHLMGNFQTNNVVVKISENKMTAMVKFPLIENKAQSFQSSGHIVSSKNYISLVDHLKKEFFRVG